MLIGKYYHSLEANRRVSLPSIFRSFTKNWVVTRGLDGCLFLLKKSEFSTQISQIANKSFTKKQNRDLVRLMTNEAKEVNIDANGRVHLPEYLTKFANLSKDLVLVGSYNYVEIWDRDKYHQYLDQIEPNINNIAESIDDHN